MTEPPDPHEAAQTLRTVAGKVVPKRAERAADRAGRKWFVRAVAAASGVAVCIATAGVVIALSAVAGQARTTASLTALRQLAQQGYDAGQAANRELSARGQQPVPIPPPGKADDTDVIVAAAAARVLASQPMHPTAAELGRGIAAYFQAHPVTPVGPTPAAIASVLAGYLATHPIPAGPSGPPGASGAPGQPGLNGTNGTNGQDGHTPTQAEIETDFQDYLTAHPEALCPQGGVFTLVSGLLADDGTTYSGWLCVTASTAPVPTTTVQPTETTATQPPPILPLPT